MRHCTIFAIALFVGLAGGARAGEKVPIDQVPENLVREVKTTNPGATIVGVERSGGGYDFELQRDKTTYHVSVGGGRLRNTSYEDDNAPGWLTEGAKKMLPNAKVVRVVVTDDSSLQMGITVFLKDGQRNIRVNCSYAGGPAMAHAYSVTRELAPSELPAIVARAVAEKHPRGMIETICEKNVFPNVYLMYNITLRIGEDHWLVSSDDKGNVYTDYLIPPKQLAILREFPTTEPATTRPATQPVEK